MRKNIVEYFDEVETKQEYKGYFCSIPEAISIVVLGSICGLRNISQIHQWAESDSVIGFLKEKFGIEHIPCYYWLLSLLKLIKPESLNKCLMKWAEAMLPEERRGLTVSLDGKTVRSTSKMESYDSPLPIISAQISELGITFASKSVEGKSNEIPAVQQLIDELDIRDCLVTRDGGSNHPGQGRLFAGCKRKSACFGGRNSGICSRREPEKNDGLHIHHRKKPRSGRNADCIHHSGYRLAVWEGEVEESELYWCD